MFELDERGVAGCFVVTAAFEAAADMQCRALGFRPEIVWLEHPIQNRTAMELERLAERCVETVIGAITQAA